MYDELVKALRGCVLSKPCNGCPYYDSKGMTEKCATMNIAAADAIEELQKRVPKRPHGRLIDADALLKDDDRMYKMYRGSNGRDTTLDDACHRAIHWRIEDAPTVIPADPAEEG